MALEIIPKPDSISWEDITDLLHQAFAEHKAKGLHYSACDQSVDVTRKRAENGICLVALQDGELVGTGLVNFVQRHGTTIGCLSQLGILPEVKGHGIGTKLKIARIEICRQKKVDAIYCDTSEKAKSVIRFNMQKGWQKVGLISSVNTNYYSVVFRYPVRGRKYSQMEANVRFFFSSLFCRSLWRENGSLRPLGKLLKKVKYLLSKKSNR